jgi:hypothetical protein
MMECISCTSTCVYVHFGFLCSSVSGGGSINMAFWGTGTIVRGHCAYISTVGTDLYGCEYFNLSQKV